eukprot:s2556_g6.t1
MMTIMVKAFEKRIAKFKRKSQSKRNKERKRKITDHKQAQLQAQKKLDKSNLLGSMGCASSRGVKSAREAAAGEASGDCHSLASYMVAQVDFTAVDFQEPQLSFRSMDGSSRHKPKLSGWKSHAAYVAAFQESLKSISSAPDDLEKNVRCGRARMAMDQ